MAASVSVIVPVYEQWNLIPGLLARLAGQTMPQDEFEVILVDNGSAEFAPPAHLPANVRIQSCTAKGSYAARNAGAAIASGNWFAFTDADCLPEPGWLAALAQGAQEADDRTIIVGAVDLKPAENPPNAYEIYDMIKGIPQQRYARSGYGATANLAVSRALFRAAGGFDGTRLSGGDAEFCRRAASHGARLVYVGAARVGHPARATWDAIATKARRVVGGQIGAGSPLRRAYRVVRILAPPIVRCARIGMAGDVPLRGRLAAIGIQLRLWLSEIGEMIRLMAGGSAERR